MVTRFGLTWWGQRWIASLEALGAGYANRLPRGRTYARKGTVRDLTVKPGAVTARVEGSRPSPYRVSLRMPVFSDGQWASIVTALAGEIRHAAALLDGRMPEDVDEVLADCGVSLFPHAGELTATCTCPDHANPCKHVAAVHYVLAQTFDADPFLLPALRGRDRTALLAGLRAARTAGPVDVAAEDRHDGGDGVSLTRLSAATLFDATGDLAAIAVHPRPPDDVTAMLRRLGPPPGLDPSMQEKLAEVLGRAAENAWRLASADSEPTADLLLTELRRRGTATTQELSTALDRPAEQVRAGLRALVATGLAQRTGHAGGTRYHA